MHNTHPEDMHFVASLRNRLAPSDYERVEVVVCPPFTALRTVQTTIDGGDLDIGLGAQNMHWEEKGAYTGEISSLMLVKIGVSTYSLGLRTVLNLSGVPAAVNTGMLMWAAI